MHSTCLRRKASLKCNTFPRYKPLNWKASNLCQTGCHLCPCWAGMCISPFYFLFQVPHISLRSTPVSACYDGHMRLHSATDGSIVHEVHACADSLTAVAAGAGVLAAGSSDGGVHVYQSAKSATAAPSHVLSVRTVDAVQSMAVVGSGKNTIVFAGSWGGMVQGWHMEALTTQAQQGSGGAAAKGARGSKRRAGADSAVADGISDISPTVELIGHKSAISGITSLTAGGDNLLATGSWDHSVRVWDCVGGGVELDTYACNKVVSCIAAAPGSAPGAGYLFATGHPDHLVRLWDSRTAAGQTGRMSESGRPTALPAAHTSWVTSMAWHPSRAHMFASGSQDGTVRVWDTRSTKPLFTLHSHAEKEEGEYEPASAKATKESQADTRPALTPEGVKILGLAWGPAGEALWSGGSDAEIHKHLLPGGGSAEA